MKIQINEHGVFGACAIFAMILISLLRAWQIPWLYVVVAIVGYASVVIWLTYVTESMERELKAFNIATQAQMSQGRARLESEEVEQKLEALQRARFDIFRWLLGSHIAFSFLTFGLLIPIENSLILTGLFCSCVALGYAIPFLVLKWGDRK